MSDSGGDKGGFGVDLGSLFTDIFGGGGSGSPSTGLPDTGGGTPAPTVSPTIDSPSPFVTTNPITPGGFDYLGGGTPPDTGGATGTGDAGGLSQTGLLGGGTDPGSNVAPGAGFTTSDAALTTPTLGSPPAGSTGPTFGDWTSGFSTTAAPVAAGGASSVSGGAVDTSSALGGTPSLATSGTGVGATSIAPAAASAGSTADATSSWGDLLNKGLTSNPLSTALTAAGLGYNIWNGQKQTANQNALTADAQTATANNTKLTNAGIDQISNNTATANKLADIGTNQTQQNIATNTGLTDKGSALTSYLSTGTLPPEYMSQVDTAISDAKTTAISNAVKNGQPGDPTKNTSLAQQLAQIDQQKPQMVSQLAQTLFNSGASLEQIGTGANTSAASSLLGSGVNTNNASAASLLSGGQNAASLSGQLYTTLTNMDTQQSAATAKAIAALASSLNAGQPNTTQKAAA